MDFEVRGITAEAVYAQHAIRKSAQQGELEARLEDAARRYRAAAERYAGSSLKLFSGIQDFGRLLDQSEPEMEDAVYEEWYGTFIEKAEVALEFGEDCLQHAKDAGLENEDIPHLRDFVDHWTMELRDRDSFYAPGALKAFVTEIENERDTTEWVDGAFGR